MPLRVAVTGGAGFIGTNLVRCLVKRGDEVVVVDDLSTGNLANLDGVAASIRVGTVLDGSLLDETFDGIEAVVHLAALPSVPRSIDDPVASHTANASGTLTVLEAARRAGNPHVILASSSSVYGSNPTLPKNEELAVAPVSPYAASKLAAEAYGLAYQACFGVPVLALRFFNVFGPHQSADHAYAAVIPRFVDAALSGRPLTIHGDGKQTRDFTFVGSVVSVITDALDRQVADDRPVNLAFGSRLDLLTVTDCLGKLAGRTMAIEFGASRPGDVRHSQADASRLTALFPAIQPVPFEEGLRITWDWFCGESRNKPN